MKYYCFRKEINNVFDIIYKYIVNKNYFLAESIIY